MAQNTQEENKAIYLDPFRYNQFEGFNSHNHVVVTEVGEGTSVVEVNRLLKQYDMMLQLVKQMSGNSRKMKKLAKMGGMPGMPGMGGFPGM